MVQSKQKSELVSTGTSCWSLVCCMSKWSW